MEKNNINEIIKNVMIVKKDNLQKNIKNIIFQIETVLNSNQDIIKQTNEIDKKNNNGFIMDFNIIRNIFSNLEKNEMFYGDVTLLQKDEEKKILYGTQIMDCGNVVVVNDGNPYIIIEMIIRNIMAGNITIFSNNGYMYGTNKLIIHLVQSVLEQFDISKNLIQIYISENYEEIFNNYANIDLVVCIGDQNLQRNILKKSKNNIIISGYENFDLYIEDISNIEFINKIVDTGLNIQMYIKDDINYDNDKSIRVNDIEEAISQINYNGSRYSTSIFTSSKENASKFIKEVKSKIVTVNTSPTIERIIDISQKDLIIEKTIIYPFEKSTDKE